MWTSSAGAAAGSVVPRRPLCAGCPAFGLIIAYSDAHRCMSSDAQLIRDGNDLSFMAGVGVPMDGVATGPPSKSRPGEGVLMSERRRRHVDVPSGIACAAAFAVPRAADRGAGPRRRVPRSRAPVPTNNPGIQPCSKVNLATANDLAGDCLRRNWQRLAVTHLYDFCTGARGDARRGRHGARPQRPRGTTCGRKGFRAPAPASVRFASGSRGRPSRGQRRATCTCCLRPEGRSFLEYVSCGAALPGRHECSAWVSDAHHQRDRICHRLQRPIAFQSYLPPAVRAHPDGGPCRCARATAFEKIPAARGRRSRVTRRCRVCNTHDAKGDEKGRGLRRALDQIGVPDFLGSPFAPHEVGCCRLRHFIRVWRLGIDFP